MKHLDAVAIALALSMGGSIGQSIGHASGMRQDRSIGRVVAGKTPRERVPKMLRQYGSRYGKHSPESILQMHAKFPTPPLDHWRDRGNIVRKALGYPEGERSEWEVKS